MKLKLIIDKTHSDPLVLYAHEKSALTDRIERLARESEGELLGYRGSEIRVLGIDSIICVFSRGGRVYALTEDCEMSLKERLYTVEEKFGASLVRINQSCLVNPSRIKCFSASVGGSLTVEMTGGYRDYVSRRQLRAVKERFGIR